MNNFEERVTEVVDILKVAICDDPDLLPKLKDIDIAVLGIKLRNAAKAICDIDPWTRVEDGLPSKEDLLIAEPDHITSNIIGLVWVKRSTPGNEYGVQKFDARRKWFFGKDHCDVTHWDKITEPKGQ